ncbi:class I SAM-dependent methyltransferase [Antrihabitans spumae]|uniref:Class I SAM-dependent methyltransferase n=1 Tax=Antrihabitans spumae TaxID=3373370 RepID=A0ABW7KQR6_9NOCA
MTSAEYRTLFNSTRSDFTKITPLLWGPAGQSLAFAMRHRPGDVVLDVCCGTGTSALPAAAAVGPTGRVHGIDLAEDLLEEGRLTASAWAFQNVDFVAADATTWEPPSVVPAAGYDALCSSYGVFFLPHMDSSFARLLRLVRTGGRVGLAVWREKAFAEIAAAYFEVLGRRHPELAQGQAAPRTRGIETAREAGARLDTADKLAAWLGGFGTESIQVTELSNLLPATEEFCWNLVLGSGFRAPLAALDDVAIEQIRSEFIDLVTDRGIHTIDAGTLIATAVVTR